MFVQEYSGKWQLSWWDIKKTFRTFLIFLGGAILAIIPQVLMQFQEYISGAYELDGVALTMLATVFGALVDAFRRLEKDYSNDKYKTI